MRLWHLSLFSVAIFQLAACATAPPRFPIPGAEEAVGLFRKAEPCRRALSGEATIDYFGDEGRIRTRSLYVGAFPERLRFDIISPFGMTLATLTSNGERFQLLQNEEKIAHWFEGPVSMCVVRSFLRVPLTPQALIQVLAGELPILIHEADRSEMQWSSGAYQLRLFGANESVQEVSFRPSPESRDLPWQKQSLELEQIRVIQADVLLYQIDFEDFQVAPQAPPREDPDGLSADLPPSGPNCEATVPRRLRIVVPTEGAEVLFLQESVEHNPPLLDSMFRQARPSAARSERLNCSE